MWTMLAAVVVPGALSQRVALHVAQRAAQERPERARRFALVMVAFVVDVAFCLSVGGVLGMHARMVAVNCTTIEMFEKRRAADWPYDRGARRNLEEVFGTRCGRPPPMSEPLFVTGP